MKRWRDANSRAGPDCVRSGAPPSFFHPDKGKALLLKTSAVLALALVISAGAARASSDDAWSAFRADVAKACRDAVADRIVAPTVSVDPHGSASHGFAMAKGFASGPRGRPAKTVVSIICVYDKATKAIETSGETAFWK